MIYFQVLTTFANQFHNNISVSLSCLEKKRWLFLARLYESSRTRRAIALTTASVSALALQNVKIFKSLYLMNLWMDLVDTLPD